MIVRAHGAARLHDVEVWQAIVTAAAVALTAVPFLLIAALAMLGVASVEREQRGFVDEKDVFRQISRSLAGIRAWLY